MDLAIKVYDIDYSFLLKNYLNPEYWNKSWHLFVYKDFVFDLSMYSIDCEDKKICFKVKGTHGEDSRTTFIYYYLNNTTIPVLKKQINGAIISVMESIEKCEIREQNGYTRLCELEAEENEQLESLAVDFLDEHGIDNKKLRELFIDDYKSAYSTMYEKKEAYIENNLYTVFTDMYVTFTSITKDETRLNNILAKTRNIIDLNKINKELEEYGCTLTSKEHLEYLKDGLEEIEI